MKHCFDGFEPPWQHSGSGAKNNSRFVFAPNKPDAQMDFAGMFANFSAGVDHWQGTISVIEFGDNFYPYLGARVEDMFHNADIDRIYAQNWYHGVWGDSYPVTGDEMFDGCNRLPNYVFDWKTQTGSLSGAWAYDSAEGGLFNDTLGSIYHYPKYKDSHGVDVYLMFKVEGSSVHFLTSNQILDDPDEWTR